MGADTLGSFYQGAVLIVWGHLNRDLNVENYPYD